MVAVLLAAITMKLKGKVRTISLIFVPILPFVVIYLQIQHYLMSSGEGYGGGAPLYSSMYYTVAAPFVIFYLLICILLFFYGKKVINKEFNH